MSSRRETLFAAALFPACVAPLFCAPALAQSADPPKAVPDGVQEVVVTARRREERIQDVPVAVSVLGSEQLRSQGITRLDDLARSTPALQTQSASFGKHLVAYTIRSQRQSESVITQDPSVGVYFADVVQARAHGVNSALFDLASVQVLKGPQGTLFGRNTTGGAVIMTPQAPTGAFEGYVRSAFGNYDQSTLEAAVNLPVSDQLQLRFGAQRNRRDGYVTNLYDGGKLEDEHTDSWRFSARYMPTSALENRLVVSGFKADEDGVASHLVGIGPPASQIYPGLQAVSDELRARGSQYVNSNYRSLADVDTLSVSNTTTYELGTLTFKNIFGYRRLESNIQNDLDGSPNVIFQSYDRIDAKQYSDELQLIGKALGQQLDYIAGAYYFREDGRNENGNAPFGARRDNAAEALNENTSVFVQASYHLQSLENVSVTAGVRQNWDRREVQWSNYAGTPSACALRDADSNGAPLNPCSREGDADFSDLTYTTSADWRINRGALVYVTHRKGYRAGGFNLRSNTPSQSQPFDPETVKDYEIGFKTDWLDGPMPGRLNVAAYHQDYEDIQRQQAILVNGVFVGSTIINAAAARIDGVEIELGVSLLPSLELSLFYSYSRPEYTRWDVPQANGSVADLSASDFAGAPRNSGGGSITWRLPVAQEYGSFALSANVYSQSMTYVQDATLNPTTQQPITTSQLGSYTVANARLEWEQVMRSGFDAALFVRNLADEDYYTGGLDLVSQGVGVNSRFIGAPRTYGAELTYRF